MKNFWKMSDFSLFANTYVYVDHNSYLADALFAQRKIAMKFKDALEKLKTKMLLLGYTDYVDICGEIDMLIGKRCEGEK